MTHTTSRTNQTYQKFLKRWEEVIDLPPQRLGSLTPHYKQLTKHLKVMPWPLFALSSLVIVLAVYLFAGSAITLVVSLLQRGF